MKTLNQITKEYNITRYRLIKLIRVNYLIEEYDYEEIYQIHKPIIKFNANGEQKIKEYIKNNAL